MLPVRARVTRSSLSSCLVLSGTYHLAVVQLQLARWCRKGKREINNERSMIHQHLEAVCTYCTISDVRYFQLTFLSDFYFNTPHDIRHVHPNSH